jgi:DNA-binding XRE family transcriptional regulator
MPENLLIAIRRRRLRQYELAALARISETTLSLILRGRVKPSPQVKKRLAAALEMDVKEIFDENEKARR